MSNSDVYEDEMPNSRFSDQEVERLLSGDTPEAGALAQLAPILKSLHGKGVVPAESQIQLFAATAAETARATGSEDAARGVASQSRLSRPKRTLAALKRKLATGMATVLALSGMTGVAVASDGAAPGDALYGIDRALEAIGLGDGGPAERIAEAQALFDDGLVPEAIEHAAEAVPGSDEEDVQESEMGVEALRTAATSVTSTNPGEADEVRAKVGEMLAWMADHASNTNGASGNDFGQEIAKRARSISGDPGAVVEEEKPDDLDSPADDPKPNIDADEDSDQDASNGGGPPDGVPGGPPEDVPGPPGGVPGRP